MPHVCDAHRDPCFDSDRRAAQSTIDLARKQHKREAKLLAMLHGGTIDREEYLSLSEQVSSQDEESP